MDARTLAEKRLGEALVGYRDKVILATKAGRYNALPLHMRLLTEKGAPDWPACTVATTYTQVVNLAFNHIQQNSREEQVNVPGKTL